MNLVCKIMLAFIGSVFLSSNAFCMTQVPDMVPRKLDYTLMWWASGWEEAVKYLPGKAVMCFQTGRFGMMFDATNRELLKFGPIKNELSISDALCMNNSLIMSLPSSSLQITVMVDGKHYKLQKSIPPSDSNTAEWLRNFPAKMVESGNVFQRLIITGLEFQDEHKYMLDALGKLEIGVWPDRVAFAFVLIPKQKQGQWSVKVALSANGNECVVTRDLDYVKSPNVNEIATVLHVGPQGKIAPDDSLEITATDYKANLPVGVEYQSLHNWYCVTLPNEPWLEQDPQEFDRLERVRIKLKNPQNDEQSAHVMFAKDYNFNSVTGMVPMLRDVSGNPTGIPVQISKNWHGVRENEYQGLWFHGLSFIRVPANSEIELEFAITYCRWGKVPAASHAQLCLIGYAANQLWDECAVGSWGESICYDPEVCLTRSMIDDIRPLYTWTPGKEHTKFVWGQNIGGGDFLVYFDSNGVRQRVSKVKTQYKSYGPNLTEAVYSGYTRDDHIKATISVSTPRTDDYVRAFHHLRYDVLKDTPFTRIAFYQLGADGYNSCKVERIARGNVQGLVEQWEPNIGLPKYQRSGIAASGSGAWFALLTSKTGSEVALGDRGLIIRSWRGRLGGKVIKQPYISVFGVNDGGVPSANIELSPPTDLRVLKKGDYIDVLIEILWLPMSAEEYYGPNIEFLAALRDNAHTWKMIWREAAGNNLKIDTGLLGSKVMNSYPVQIDLNGSEKTALTIVGGVGYIPITFTGLDSYAGFTLMEIKDGREYVLDQSVHGNDFWQCNYDPERQTWSRTYNVEMNAVDFEHSSRKFCLKKAGK